MPPESDSARRSRLLAAARRGSAQAQFDFWDHYAYEPGSLKWLKRAADAGEKKAREALRRMESLR